ncbi:MFS transporter [Aestuariibacter halophilus]|uniref:3-methyl-2-oxobutanoate dehydrogenase (2-methylpropanoyl-transferring) n=1 Tax=Fluctibacter halophilus TaxID=226011 RepID=A0ABS8GBE2_9ALTE|nr:alpha-ketoacid dehydrogenase subunit alpha/beta [Aestuariibacter halophilus]MCC2617718.1 MFS transporter [Aestuariibacter halophilus]
MQDRNAVVRQQFIDAVQEGNLPSVDLPMGLADTDLTPAQLVDLFESQIMSRHLDLRSRQMQKDGNSFYTIGSAGHEGNAACALAARPDDMAFLHYRSGAFVVQRSKQVDGETPLYDMLLSFAASSEDPISGGRHKVLGSKSLSIPPQTSTIASHLPKAVGAAFSIALSQKRSGQHPLPKDSVILCNFGDASANHSTAQGALNTACWAAFQSVPLPIVFICEDNGIGISTRTPNGWIAANFSRRPGMTYVSCDGLNVLDTYRQTQRALDLARRAHKPVFLHMRTVRLLGHAGSDAEFVYRSAEDIARNEAMDPLLYTAKLVIDEGLMTPEQVVALYLSVEARVEHVSRQAAGRPRLETAEQIKHSIIPPCRDVAVPPVADSDTRAALFAHEKHNLKKPQHLAKLLNWAMMDILAQYDNTLVFGEDVGKKGGVYNVTAKLYEKFGPARVINTLLDEQAILGAAIGLAHNGFIPMPEIQFLAYVHNAEDQIRGEAATLPFFSNGQFTNPMVIRIAGLAYQRGFGGHFHNDNSLAVFRDIPGIVIACPSNGRDAVHMLRRSVQLAHQEQRVVVFIEPIALYMKKDLLEEGDNGWSFDYPAPDEEGIALSEFGLSGEGKDVLIISYGNGHYLSSQAAHDLAQQGIQCTLMDLRWLAPLDEAGIADAARGYSHVLVVDECRRTGSISEALVTLLHERIGGQQIARVTAEDCFIPLGSASYAVLPSREQIVSAAVALVGLEGDDDVLIQQVSGQ